tara:strand:+ start:408 stop:857 length:450 start_codon:yes stop_codon:yes gene_type:complete
MSMIHISSYADAKRVFGTLKTKLVLNHDTQIVYARAYDDNDIIRWAGVPYEIQQQTYYLTVSETNMSDGGDISFTFHCKDKKEMLDTIIKEGRIDWWFENAYLYEEREEFIDAAGGKDNIFSSFDKFMSFYEKYIGDDPVDYKYELVRG